MTHSVNHQQKGKTSLDAKNRGYGRNLMSALDEARDDTHQVMDEELEEETSDLKEIEKWMPPGMFFGSQECIVETPGLPKTPRNSELSAFYKSVQLQEKYMPLVKNPLAHIPYKDPREDSFCTEGARVQISCTMDSDGVIHQKMVRPSYLTTTPLG